MVAQASPVVQSSPVEPICGWCDARGVQAFANLWDFDPLRDAKPPLLWLCVGCAAEAGLVVDEPDACAEHRAGCPDGAHFQSLQATAA